RQRHYNQDSAIARPFIEDAAKARLIGEIVQLYQRLRGNGLSELATLVVATVAAARSPSDVVALAVALDRDRGEDAIVLRQRVAAKTNVSELIELLERGSHRLKGQFSELLGAIVRAASVEQLRLLAHELRERGFEAWTEQMWLAALRDPGDRRGTELVRLQGQLGGSRTRRAEGR